MALLVVLYIVFCEVKRLKFMVTVCGSDCQKGTPCHHHVVTASGAHPVVTVSCFLVA